jgi:hypothetical protein
MIALWKAGTRHSNPLDESKQVFFSVFCMMLCSLIFNLGFWSPISISFVTFHISMVSAFEPQRLSVSNYSPRTYY